MTEIRERIKETRVGRGLWQRESVLFRCVSDLVRLAYGWAATAVFPFLLDGQCTAPSLGPGRCSQLPSSLPSTLRGTDVLQGGNNAHIVSPAVAQSSLLPSLPQRLPPVLPEPPAHFVAHSGPAVPDPRG